MRDCGSLNPSQHTRAWDVNHVRNRSVFRKAEVRKHSCFKQLVCNGEVSVFYLDVFLFAVGRIFGVCVKEVLRVNFKEAWVCCFDPGINVL